ASIVIDAHGASENGKSPMKPSTNGTTLQGPSQAGPLINEPPARGATIMPPAKGKKSSARWLAIPVLILVLATAAWYWHYSSQFEETDDAYVTGHEHPVSFRVAGTISEI